MIPQRVEQGGARFDLHGHRLSVDMRVMASKPFFSVVPAGGCARGCVRLPPIPGPAVPLPAPILRRRRRHPLKIADGLARLRLFLFLFIISTRHGAIPPTVFGDGDSPARAAGRVQ